MTADLRDLIAAGTWRSRGNGDGVTSDILEDGRGSLVARAMNADAALIAKAVNALPALLDRIERLEDAIRTALPVVSGMTTVVRSAAGMSGEAAVVIFLRAALEGASDD